MLYSQKYPSYLETLVVEVHFGTAHTHTQDKKGSELPLLLELITSELMYSVLKMRREDGIFHDWVWRESR